MDPTQKWTLKRTIIQSITDGGWSFGDDESGFLADTGSTGLNISGGNNEGSGDGTSGNGGSGDGDSNDRSGGGDDGGSRGGDHSHAGSSINDQSLQIMMGMI
ncbi:hypothetical protein CCUS01_01974 [Colletotrichum cuscutae]|uniref:Uncharacterized protein n=1 Tax=Colletotrichum cuscutae TaxID=1209917 RepID=A0AAI9U9M1_9PEZI|nr:hypothetical protein CCUS01_01974 [Colletotrichum cuscutae]